jgi:tetratricopeptide (TPR) repeat protein
MSPAWIHNYVIAREPVLLSAHSGINFWIGNHPGANGFPKMPPGIRASQEGLLRDSITRAEEAAGRKLKRFEVSRYWSGKANAYIAENPQAWAALLGTKFRNFWSAYQYDDLAIIKLLRDHGVLPPGLRFGVVAAFGLAGLPFALRRFPRSGWIAAGVVLHMAAILPVFVTERYRLAAIPGLLLLGTAGLWILWDHLAHRRWRAAGFYVALLAATSWFVSHPQPDLSLWSLDHYKAGIRATEAGQLERAQENLQTAVAYSPDSSDIHLALGNVALAKGDRRTATGAYLRALALNPEHERVLNNLGVLAFEQKAFAVAERLFLSTIKHEPSDPKSHYLLARTRFELGNLEGAKAALAEALRIHPGQREFLDLQERIQSGESTARPERDPGTPELREGM